MEKKFMRHNDCENRKSIKLNEIMNGNFHTHTHTHVNVRIH